MVDKLKYLLTHFTGKKAVLAYAAIVFTVYNHYATKPFTPDEQTAIYTALGTVMAAWIGQDLIETSKQEPTK